MIIGASLGSFKGLSLEQSIEIYLKLSGDFALGAVEIRFEKEAGLPFLLSEEENERLFRAKAEDLDTKLGNLMMPLRVAITGSRVSPPLFGSIRLLGGDEAQRRVERAIGSFEDRTTWRTV